MRIEPHELGTEKNRLLIVDDFLPDARQVVAFAARRAPFAPEKTTSYPGLRHQLTPDQPEGAAYVRAVLQAAAPAICGAFGARGFDIVEASLSIVTTRPPDLTPVQRMPHFDSPDPNHVAILHHLHDLPGTGTAFYRHRRTGFERASAARRTVLEPAWREDRLEYGEPQVGLAATGYDKIFQAQGRFNRLLIYQGALFHSGVLPPDFSYDPDPRTGRLTGTLFVKLTPNV